MRFEVETHTVCLITQLSANQRLPLQALTPNAFTVTDFYEIYCRLEVSRVICSMERTGLNSSMPISVFDF